MTNTFSHLFARIKSRERVKGKGIKMKASKVCLMPKWSRELHEQKLSMEDLVAKRFSILPMKHYSILIKQFITARWRKLLSNFYFPSCCDSKVPFYRAKVFYRNVTNSSSNFSGAFHFQSGNCWKLIIEFNPTVCEEMIHQTIAIRCCFSLSTSSSSQSSFCHNSLASVCFLGWRWKICPIKIFLVNFLMRWRDIHG